GRRPFTATRSDELLEAMRKGPDWPRSEIPGWLRQALGTGLQLDPGRRFESMPALLTALDPQPHSRRRAMVGAAVLGMVSLLGGYALSAGLSRPSPGCQDAARRLDGTWDGPLRREVEDAFSRLTAPYAQASLRATVTALDRYAERWSGAFREVCAARDQHPGTADPQLRCLQSRRQQMGELVRALSHADARVAEGALAAAQSLASPQVCTDILALASRNDDPPPGPEATALGSEVGQLRASGDLGLDEKVLDASPRVTRRAQELRFPRLEATTRILAARSQLRLIQVDDAGQNLEEALVLATTAGDPELIAQAWTGLVSLAGTRQDEHASEQAARMARAALAGLVSPEADLPVELEIALGHARFRSRRYPAALEALDHAVALGDARPELSLRPRLESLLERSSVYLALDRLAEAAADAERALGLVDGTLGQDHPWRIRALIGAGLLEEVVGRPARALPFYTRAVELADRAIGPVHPTTAHALVRVGAMLLMQDRLGEAQVALARAREIEQRYYPPTHLTRADLGFLMATVDWQRERTAEANEVLRALTDSERRRNPQGPAWVAFGMSVVENDLELHRVDRAMQLLDALRPFTRGRGEIYRSIIADLDGRAALERRRYREALETLDAVTRTYAALKAQDGLLYADALKHRSLALQALGRRDEAIAGLEDAARVQERQQSFEQLAQTRFFLARALWQDPGRRADAISLAETALEGTKIVPRRREIEAWLGHRGVARAGTRLPTQGGAVR
ncbi:MAG TPA: tetratricopeptide repeat protein, partial [Myxococcaceae bacterium]|nr:tetratricopeptide repeat protein [Myxococcaceae bacterium]